MLRLLGASVGVVFAVRGLAGLLARRGTSVVRGGPVIPVVDLDEERIGPGEGLAG